MIVSYNLLSKYVDLSNISIKEFCDKLTLAGFEIEGVNQLSSGTNLVIGENTITCKALGKNGKPDIIIIFLGTNDNVNGYHSQYESAYESAIKTIEKLYPDAYIFACKMGYSPFNKYYYTEEMRLNFNDTIEKLAEKYKQEDE